MSRFIFALAWAQTMCWWSECYYYGGNCVVFVMMYQKLGVEIYLGLLKYFKDWKNENNHEIQPLNLRSGADNSVNFRFWAMIMKAHQFWYVLMLISLRYHHIFKNMCLQALLCYGTTWPKSGIPVSQNDHDFRDQRKIWVLEMLTNPGDGHQIFVAQRNICLWIYTFEIMYVSKSAYLHNIPYIHIRFSHKVLEDAYKSLLSISPGLWSRRWRYVTCSNKCQPTTDMIGAIYDIQLALYWHLNCCFVFILNMDLKSIKIKIRQ